MSTPSSQNDSETGRDSFRHGLNQNLKCPQLQQQYQHLPLTRQSFETTNCNISLHQQAAVIQQQATLGTPSLAVPSAEDNSAVLAAVQPATQFFHWSKPVMGSTPYLQHHQQSTAAPQQQHFNDLLFNIQAQAAYATLPPAQVASTATQQETYSVLRVGNGNFLKIYHCPENNIVPLSAETSFGPMPQYNQGQGTNLQHGNQPGSPTVQSPLRQQQSQSQISGITNAATSQAFNSYELFSSNTFTQLPTAETPPLLLLGPAAKHPLITTVGDINNIEQAGSFETANINANNMVYNSEISNGDWNGANHHIGASLYTQLENCQRNSQNQESIGSSIAKSEDILPDNGSNINLEKSINTHIGRHQQFQLQQNLHLSKGNIVLAKSTSVATLLATPAIKAEIPRQEVPKKRIVAEVKPMRMTYSDVLSKFNNQAQNSPQNNLNNLSATTTTSSIPIVGSQRNAQKAKIDLNIANNSSNNLRRVNDDTTTTRISRKSPTHENKENQQQQMVNKLNNNVKRSIAAAAITNNTFNTNNNIGPTLNKSASSQKNLVNISKNSAISGSGNTNANHVNDNQQSKRQRSSRNSDNKNNAAKNFCSNERGTTKIYGTNSSTATINTYNFTNNTNARKPTKSSNSSNLSSATGQQRSRYQNNSNASYSYLSTKRNRNSSSYGASATLNNAYANGAGSSRNYELARRVLQAWYTYTLKILTWLFYLVYDIVVLGCSILYDRLICGFESGKSYANQLYKELKQNSNKPGIWFKNYCRRLDAKFSKTSKWAFWRKFFKKKQPETASESTKTGRLPATGEEAMYQLLNCKGKDAYSILGVPPNSSQEQIRKHYKKIAVLVHPDKNKQAGAEEAFKVLQRAFELIGEPENRVAYDQSLAEALHAEKAWTELHDLLSQLQTKITEAANTIRCSTCGLRHPRKITDRPHYAARECASCKIRHSSREGDIWAETSMLGLRWKYLALMEGKVYDITEWANCQKGALAHLEPNSHMVQYRIVRGAQQQQQQQQHQQKQQAQQQHHQQQHTGSQYPGTGGIGGKFKRDNITPSEASLHEFLDNLYSGQHPQQQQQNTSAYSGSSRRRSRRN